MSLFTAPVNPGRSVGFLTLGASLHDTLTRLKAEPQSFGKLDLIYSPSAPVTEPVILNLPKNGIRLRFDGPAQRLRLIEVLDFSKNRLTYNGVEIMKPSGVSSLHPSTSQDISSGPHFRHVYTKLLAPSFAGEYIPPDSSDTSGYGLYVLSYPGIAFTFPMLATAWSPSKDYAALLSSSATRPAAAMAVFGGESWSDARNTLFTQPLQDPRLFLPASKGKEVYPDEIGVVNIHGAGRVEMERPFGSAPFWLTLGNTTPQELVAELGPPDAIYRKSDQRMLIHKARTSSESRQTRPIGLDSRLQDDSTDTDQSSAHTATDASDDDSDGGSDNGKMSGECFYNYFYHGFDILISAPTKPSRPPPSFSNMASEEQGSSSSIIDTLAPLVATKLIIHSNVPGSYSFNRHRRCRWKIAYLSPFSSSPAVTSESPFPNVAERLHDEWKSIYSSPEEAKQRQRGMVLNRGWGDSPGSSCELLGGWEESADGKRVDGPNAVIPDEEQGLGNTTLYGFPGLVFEVLKNGSVSGLTVF